MQNYRITLLVALDSPEFKDWRSRRADDTMLVLDGDHAYIFDYQKRVPIARACSYRPLEVWVDFEDKYYMNLGAGGNWTSGEFAVRDIIRKKEMENYGGVASFEQIAP